MALLSDIQSARPASTVGAHARLRAGLIAGCLAAATIAYLAGNPAPALRADPALAGLLRGMAALKALLVVGAFAAVWWRFGRAVSPLVAAGYLTALAVMSAGAVLIWQLSFIGATAIGFHAALIGLFVIALRDDRFTDLRPHASRR